MGGLALGMDEFLWLSAAFSSFQHLADSSYLANVVDTTSHLLTMKQLHHFKEKDKYIFICDNHGILLFTVPTMIC